MRGLACLALMALTSCATPPDMGPDHSARIYQSCPGREALGNAVNISWTQRESLVTQHRALRQRLGTSLPEAGKRILLFAAYAHHTRVDHSLVATRQADGIWYVDQVGEEKGGILAIETKALPRKAYALSASESGQVDALLKGRCLYASPTFLRDPNIASGGVVQTLEVEAPRRRAVLAWLGFSTPEVEQLVKLILR